MKITLIPLRCQWTASGAMDRTGWPGQAFCDFVATMRPGGRVEPGQRRPLRQSSLDFLHHPARKIRVDAHRAGGRISTAQSELGNAVEAIGAGGAGMLGSGCEQ